MFKLSFSVKKDIIFMIAAVHTCQTCACQICNCMHSFNETSKVNLQRHFFIIPTDGHNYEITGMLKNNYNSDNCSDMFRFTQETSSGSYFVLS